MKTRILALLTFAAIFLPCAAAKRRRGAYRRDRHQPLSLLSLCTTGTWQEFARARENLQRTNKSVLVGAITLKNKEVARLGSLVASWRGKPQAALSAALYSKKKSCDPLIPIEENLICDGHWDPKKQQFTFPVNKKLVAIDTYYLVLSFPQNAERAVRNGKITIEKGKKSATLALR